MPQESSLIEVKPQAGGGKFFAAAFVAFAVLSAIWCALMDGFVFFKTPFAYTTTESNVHALMRASLTSAPDLAIAGSSLSMRLEPGLFAETTVANYAAEGGNMLTGLEILLRRPTLPKTILVEANILDREADDALASTIGAAARSRLLAVLSGTVKPLRYLMTRPFFRHAAARSVAEDWRNRRAAAFAEPATTYRTEATIQAGIAAWNRRDAWDLADQNARRLRNDVAELEARGARVFLMYLPYDPAYDRQFYARRHRELVGGGDAFQCLSCLDVRRLVDVSELRWEDGAHLDERSAALVAKALETAVRSTP